MPKLLLASSFVLATSIALHAAPAADVIQQLAAAKLLSTAPLRFEPAANGKGEFLVRGLRFHAAMSADRLRLEAAGRSMRLRFAGASRESRLTGGEPLASKTNILVGNDRSKWRTKVPNYKDLRVASLYPGIGLRYYGREGQLEYDLTVEPKADPSQVRLQFEGDQPAMDANGNLTAAFLHKRPVAYQVANGKNIPVESRYVRNTDGTFGIRLGRYDASREVVIDSVLTFSTYLAGTGQDIAYGIGHDSKGFLYVAGTTAATDFNLAGDSNKTTNSGSFDVFVAKLDPSPGAAAAIVYATYLGGANADNLKSMAVSPNGLVYLAGVTASSDFPMAGNAAQTALSGTTDAFLAVVDPSQASGSALVYSTYFGGTKDDTAFAITYDSSGLIYAAGDTDSTDLPLNNSYQGSMGGSASVVVNAAPNSTGTDRIGTITVAGMPFVIGQQAMAVSGSARRSKAVDSHRYK